MINKINSNINFSRGPCPITVPLLQKITSTQGDCIHCVKIGKDFTPVYSSNYKKDYFDALARVAELDENIKQAKRWQEIADRKKIEEGYLDLKI